jgi:hypothetical protein
MVLAKLEEKLPETKDDREQVDAKLQAMQEEYGGGDNDEDDNIDDVDIMDEDD